MVKLVSSSNYSQLKVIHLTSEKGFKDAEKLKSLGWEITNVGFNTVTLAKPKN